MMIKSLLFTLAFALISTFSVQAQRVAVVDIARILENMPEYKTAQKQLDELSATWRQEVNSEMDKIKGMYNKYQAELPLLNEEMKKKREEEITSKEKQVRDLQKERFGTEGTLFVKEKN